jgi:hypothetical protein
MWHQWIRPNQNSFDPTEHRSICPDAESKAKQRKNGKPGTAQKYSKAEPKILDERLHISLLSTKRFDWIQLHRGARGQVTR